MSVIGSSILAGASGSAGESKVYVDDVFSTFLIEGNSSSGRAINNGIDLAGEGGLVWTKQRDNTRYHYLFDTENSGYALSSDLTSPKVSASNRLTAFNNNGFTLGSDSDVNQTSSSYASWTFRKQKGFFDVLTFSGTGSAQNISHSLGSVPGTMLVRCLVGTHDWEVYHRSTGATKSLHLNQADAATTDSTVWNNTTPTATQFTVGTSNNVNQSGHTYVAYIFAHDEPVFGTDGDESIIKCGGYTGTGSAGNFINLGFEPQWVIIKRTNDSGNWMMFDMMRGIPTGGIDSFLLANTSAAEVGPGDSYQAEYLSVNSTGFTLESNAGDTNGSGKTFIYMAIRRPNKPPELATEVFAITKDNNGSPYSVGFPTDAYLYNLLGGNSTNSRFLSRLTGQSAYLVTSSAAAEVSNTNTVAFDLQNNFDQNISASSNIGYNFRRAPGFMDVVTFSGTGSLATHNHNLTVAPELMFVKNRTSGRNWRVYAAPVGAGSALVLNTNDGPFASAIMWNDTAPTSSVFTVNTYADVNQSGASFVNYLFATLPGISKVGSYSGNTGYAVNVDCGFTNGARFILIKRMSANGDWYVWDTLRGIASGNDPYLLLSETTAQVTNTDYIDPLSTGFTVTSSAPAALNVSGSTYLFLAIA